MRRIIISLLRGRPTPCGRLGRAASLLSARTIDMHQLALARLRGSMGINSPRPMLHAWTLQADGLLMKNNKTPLACRQVVVCV